MSPAAAALFSLGTLIVGAMLGGLIKAVQDRYVVFCEGQAIAAAIRAEIEALSDIIRRRKYVGAFREMVAFLANTANAIGPNSLMEVRVTQHYFQIFDEHSGKIGLLSTAAAPVVSWYTLAKAIVEDLRTLPERHRAIPFSRQQLIEWHNNIADMFEELLTRTDAAVTELMQRERKRFGL